MRLRLGLHLDRFLDRHVPFGVELRLVTAWAMLGPSRELARERLRLGEHIVDDAVAEAPGEAFVGASCRGR